MGGGEFLDEGEFGGGFGLAFGDEGIAVDEDEAGEEAVGIAFGSGGDGTTGIEAVLAAGFALFFCALH